MLRLLTPPTPFTLVESQTSFTPSPGAWRYPAGSCSWRGGGRSSGSACGRNRWCASSWPSRPSCLRVLCQLRPCGVRWRLERGLAGSSEVVGRRDSRRGERTATGLSRGVTARRASVLLDVEGATTCSLISRVLCPSFARLQNPSTVSQSRYYG